MLRETEERSRLIEVCSNQRLRDTGANAVAAHPNLSSLRQGYQFLPCLDALILDKRIDDVAVSKSLGAEQFTRGKHSHPNIYNRILLTADRHECETILGGNYSEREFKPGILIGAVILQKKCADLRIVLASTLDSMKRLVDRLSIATSVFELNYGCGDKRVMIFRCDGMKGTIKRLSVIFVASVMPSKERLHKRELASVGTGDCSEGLVYIVDSICRTVVSERNNERPRIVNDVTHDSASDPPQSVVREVTAGSED